jgi:putative glycosyltransferase (TIGR04372 family)
VEHCRVRVGRATYLLVAPQVNADGKPVGYGNLLRQVGHAVRVAASLGLRLYLIPGRPPLNTAVYDFESPDVDVLGQGSWTCVLWRLRWHLGTPFRYGTPLLWLRARLGGGLRGPLHRLMLAARRAGWRECDGALDRWEQACRRAAASYGRQPEEAWRLLTASARERERASGKPHRRARIRLRARDLAEVERLAGQAGLDPAAPIVTLHVRESGYRRRGADRQRHVDGLRDASIETYRPALDWLLSQGYRVIRLGDRSMTPCAWPGVVDVATAPWRTDAFELWAMLRSRFFIASDSGPYFLSVLCDVPSVAVNVVQVGYYTVRPHDRYICKHARDRRTGAVMGLDEMLTPEFMGSGLDGERWDWLDNSPDELLEAVQDMHALVTTPDLPRTSGQTRHDLLLDDLTKVWRPDRRNMAALLFRRRGRGTVSAGFSTRYLDNAGPQLP